MTKSGCSRCNQSWHPALIRDAPSPARTCGSTHQLGASMAAMIESIPTRLGSCSMGLISEGHYIMAAIDEMY